MPEFLILDNVCRRCKKTPAKYEKTDKYTRRVCSECMDKQKAEWWQEKERVNAHRQKTATLERGCVMCGVGPNEYRRHGSNRDGYRLSCVTCENARIKRHQKLPEQRARASEYLRKWGAINRPKLRLEVLSHYGGVCYCCGEDNIAFLTLDHKNNDGAAHRRKVRAGGINMYAWAKKNNYPPIFQVACFNCNCARQFRNNGVCPHQEGRQKLLRLVS